MSKILRKFLALIHCLYNQIIFTMRNTQQINWLVLLVYCDIYKIIKKGTFSSPNIISLNNRGAIKEIEYFSFYGLNILQHRKA